MRHFNSRLFVFLLAGSLAATVALGQVAPPPAITSVQGSYVETESPMATSVTAGVTDMMLTVTGTNFALSRGNEQAQLVWVPSAGGCPVTSCVFDVYPLSPTQFVVFEVPDALIANADPGATVVVRNPGNQNSAPFSFPVNPPVTNAATPQAYVNVPYSAYITSGGTPVYTVNAPFTGGVPGLSPAGSALGGGKIIGAPTLTGTFSGTATVLDAWGQTALSNAYTVTVGSLPSAVQGVPYSVQSHFAGVGPYIWTTTAGSLPPGITLGYANETLSLVGTPTAPGSYSAAVRVDSPSGATVATGTISIFVVAAVQILTQSLGPMSSSGSFYATLVAGGGVPPYTWSVASGSLPAGLTLDSSSGLVSGTPTGKGSAFTIVVMDRAGVTNIKAYLLDFLLQVTPSALPAGRVGTNYLQSLTITGGSGSSICSVTQGALPPGLNMNSQGGISGLPTTAGSFTFTVQVADRTDGQVVAQQYAVTINSGALAVATASPLPDTPMGVVSIPLAATGGTLPYKWSVTAGSLPPGVSLSTAGVLTGVATAQGGFTFTATVTDAANATASKSFTIGIVPAPLTITTGAAPDGFGQTAYSATVSATGGVPPYKWSAAGLPQGLGIDSATGIVSGTPGPLGTFQFSVTVTDSVGGSNTKVFAIRVAIAPLQITSVALPNATATIAYTAKLTASGGALPYTWSVTGIIPDGFAVLSDGTVSGTYPKADTLSFPVRVVDGQGNTAAALVGLRVLPAPLVIAPTALPAGTAGLPYPQSLSSTGGVPPFVWTATLPTGLKIDANTGAISGVALVGGPQALVVTVTDANGTSARNTYPVTFAIPPLPGITFGPVLAVPATQPNIGFSLASLYPLAITGTATMTFKPDGAVTDPTVLFASGKTTLPFTFAAGAGSPTFSPGANGFQTGTLVGTITITLSLQAGGLDITPSPAPSAQIRIAPQAPVITAVTATRSGGLLTVTAQGFSVTREVVQASFHMGAAAGADVTPADFTLPVSSIFGAYFQGSSSATAGGQFLFTQQFTLMSGDLTKIQSVGVSLTNSVGASLSVIAQVQ
jgi:hypothetical protein